MAEALSNIEKMKREDEILSEMNDGRLVKMEVDYSSAVDKAIPDAEKLAQSGQLQKALDTLYSLEKQSRLAADMRSNSRIQVAIVKLCFNAKNWDALCENIVILSKKRSLIKQAICKMVQESCTYVDKMPSKELILKLIDTLRTVTAGKIYVEVERARLTYKLAKMREEEGKLDEAATVLLDLQIETYGTMEKQEKVELLLEQMRLCLARKDYVRAQIISRKISVKFFEDESNHVQTLKLKFYHLMIQLDQNESSYLAICRHYLAVSKTPMVKSDATKLDEALKNVVLYVLLAPHNNEQWDLMNRIRSDKNLEKITQYKDLLNMFITQELISWSADVVAKYENLLRQGSNVSPPTGVFDSKTDLGKQQWESFQTRVGEHNIRMIAKYYTRISMARMAELLDWPVEKTEEFLCQLVVNGTIVGAKIDRPSDLVTFQPKKSPTEVLDEWNSNLSDLMDKLNKACHLILKEEMVHKHLHSVLPSGVASASASSTATTAPKVA